MRSRVREFVVLSLCSQLWAGAIDRRGGDGDYHDDEAGPRCPAAVPGRGARSRCPAAVPGGGARPRRDLAPGLPIGRRSALLAWAEPARRALGRYRAQQAMDSREATLVVSARLSGKAAKAQVVAADLRGASAFP